MAQCLVTFAVISPIEPSLPITVDGIMDPGLPPHTPYLGTPVVFPPGQRPVSFCFMMSLQGPPDNDALRRFSHIEPRASTGCVQKPNAAFMTPPRPLATA